MFVLLLVGMFVLFCYKIYLIVTDPRSSTMDVEQLKIKAPTTRPRTKAEQKAMEDDTHYADRKAPPERIIPIVPDEAKTYEPGKPKAIKILAPVALVVEGREQLYSPRDVLKLGDYGPGQFTELLAQLEAYPKSFEVLDPPAPQPDPAI